MKFSASVQFPLCSALPVGCELRGASNADLEYLRDDGARKQTCLPLVGRTGPRGGLSLVRPAQSGLRPSSTSFVLLPKLGFPETHANKGLCGFQSWDTVLYSQKRRICSWSRAPQTFWNFPSEGSDRGVFGCAEVTSGKTRGHLRMGSVAWGANPGVRRMGPFGLSP